MDAETQTRLDDINDTASGIGYYDFTFVASNHPKGGVMIGNDEQGPIGKFIPVPDDLVSLNGLALIHKVYNLAFEHGQQSGRRKLQDVLRAVMGVPSDDEIKQLSDRIDKIA